MSRTLFGTDGVRGLAGEYPLDAVGATAIGSAVGHLFGEAGQEMVIAADTRQSSPELVTQVSAGLMAQGITVVDIGIIPTPGLAYITATQERFVAGIMITASHNPYQYNGVKVFDANGGKLSDATEAEINQLIASPPPPRETGASHKDDTLTAAYEDFLVGAASGTSLAGLQVAIDAANGAASGLAARVLERLGATVTSLFDSPNGQNINNGCGATDTSVLQKTVVEQKLDLGIALDGDADRLIMVDAQGREVKGDYLLYLLAVNGHHTGVVATVMSNLGFEQALHNKQIDLKRTDVGDRYVLEGLAETGYRLGGEQSGHIIQVDLLPTGDGLLAAISVLVALQNSVRSLASWCDEVQIVPQALVNIALPDTAWLQQQVIQDYVTAEKHRLGAAGRLLIRPSGTEPLARVMVEGPDAEATAQRIAHDLEKLLGAAGVSQ